jgi:hypothetical protein
VVAVVPPPAPARSSGCWSRRTHLAMRSTRSFAPPLEPVLLRAVIVPHRNSKSTGAREIRCVGELPHRRIQAPPAPASSPIDDSKLLRCRTAPLLKVAAPPPCSAVAAPPRAPPPYSAVAAPPRVPPPCWTRLAAPPAWTRRSPGALPRSGARARRHRRRGCLGMELGRTRSSSGPPLAQMPPGARRRLRLGWGRGIRIGR